MRFIKIQSILLALVIGLGGLFVSLGLLAMTSPVLAQGAELEGTVPVSQAPVPEDIIIIVVFTDPLSIPITDLSGNIIGEGVHSGKVRCISNTCNQKTELIFTIPLTDPWPYAEYEYKFKTRMAVDPEAARAVVAGIGTISGRGQRERFTFTATFQDNRDGTVSVTYVASRPDASFIIPRSPGTFTIDSRP
jgi:hypothetical protein